MDNLPELRDIHLPSADVAIFPLAYGWWVMLLILIVFVGLFFLIRFTVRKSKKRYALRLLANENRPNLSSAVKISEILRRICVYKYKNATILFGAEWIDFLNQHSKEKISGKTAQLLIDAPYINDNSQVYSTDDVRQLYVFCKNWIGENL